MHCATGYLPTVLCVTITPVWRAEGRTRASLPEGHAMPVTTQAPKRISKEMASYSLMQNPRLNEVTASGWYTSTLATSLRRGRAAKWDVD